MVADLLHRKGDGAAAAARLDEVLAELDEDTGPDSWIAGGAALANGLARVRFFLGEHQQCLDAAELAIRLARQEGSPAVEAEACTVGGTVLIFLDRPDDAIRVLEKGVALAAGESVSVITPFLAATATGEMVEAFKARAAEYQWTVDVVDTAGDMGAFASRVEDATTSGADATRPFWRVPAKYQAGAPVAPKPNTLIASWSPCASMPTPLPAATGTPEASFGCGHQKPFSGVGQVLPTSVSSAWKASRLPSSSRTPTW